MHRSSLRRLSSFFWTPLAEHKFYPRHRCSFLHYISKANKIFKDPTLVWFVKDNEKDLKTEECRLDTFRHMF